MLPNIDSSEETHFEAGAGDAAALPAAPGFGPFIDVWNEVQGYETPELHDLIAAWLEEAWDAHTLRLLLMVFRDAGKSTLVGLFSAWLLVRNPNLRIMVVSADQALASKMTRNIRRIIERHPWAAHLKPKRSELWAADQLTVERSRSLRDPSIIARGITGNITGSRADIVICDDVEVPNTCDTPQKRDDLRSRLAEIPFILVPGGTQLYVGTPHSYYSIYASEPRAELSERAPFLDGFKRLVLPIIDPRGTSRWPERFTPDHIQQLQRQTGPIRFRSQMLLVPAHARECRLDPDLLLRYDEPLTHRSVNGRSQLFIGGRRMVASACWWDPAYGRVQGGDASVIAVVFTDECGEYWLHALDYIRVTDTSGEDPATQQCRAVSRFLRLNEQRSLVVETNGIGQFLPGLLRTTLRHDHNACAVIERSSNTSKQQRILSAFDPLLAAQRLHAQASIWASPFIEEMREWLPDRNGRDDGLDAVSGCILNQPLRNNDLQARPTPRPDWRPGTQNFRALTSFEV